MSRVEEALRRTAIERDGGEAASRIHTGDRLAARSLEDYPLEAVRPLPPSEDGSPSGQRRRAPRAAAAAAETPTPPRVLLTSGRKLVVDRDASFVMVEQYGRLAAALYQARAEHGVKSVMVSSALPREGKTLTAANLALTLSESYRHRVLLIDTDVRGAAIHTLFGLQPTPGLGDFLGSADQQLPLVQVSETLSVVPAGTSNGHPIAGIVSDRMKRLLEEATERFDWVVLDTPPVGVLPDANLLARLADGVVFVVTAKSSPYEMVQRAITAIGVERIIGVVLNRAAQSTLPDSRYYRDYAAASVQE